MAVDHDRSIFAREYIAELLRNKERLAAAHARAAADAAMHDEGIVRVTLSEFHKNCDIMDAVVDLVKIGDVWMTAEDAAKQR